MPLPHSYVEALNLSVNVLVMKVIKGSRKGRALILISVLRRERETRALFLDTEHALPM